MAEETPVAAPPEATEQPERTQPDTAAGESEKAPSSEDKPAENANVTDDQKKPEDEADKATGADEPNDSKPEAEETAASTDANAPETNGTPASAKKSSKDRRRSSGVGEKKLNRKKSQSRITNLHVKPGEYYLARLRSYAPWPSIICDEDMLPQSLLETRPATAMQQDGTYRPEYADDGKRAHERTFPVMFFETNQFAWIVNTNLTPLDASECKEVSEKNKSKQLYRAYQVAAEEHDLQHFKSLLADHEAALQQEIEEEEAKEAAKEAAKAEKNAKKGKRKSKAAETDVEMEDVDDSKKAKGSAKKRKKDAETDGEADKPSKNAKTGPKIKLTNKAPAEETGKQPAASKAKKGGTKKGKAAASDEEEAVKAKEPEKQIDPEELKKKKEKEVLFLRHKLQKGFISRDQPPKEDEMATMGSYFDKLEKHADLEVSIIRSTKINKVLKMIVKLNSIPRDEEFNFRHRAMNILSSWKNVLDGDTPGPSADNDAKSATNGPQKDDDTVETPKQETEEQKEPETKTANDDSPMPDADAEPETTKAAPKEPEGDAPTDQAPEEKPAEEKTAEASA